jgi:hypothetical protein
MSHLVNDQIVDAIREIEDTIEFLETELEVSGIRGEFDRADQLAVELFDARKELKKIKSQF